jgi:N-sulfoglucosamine sulfohydrolase
MKPNILFITADDLNYNSTGYMGCKTPGITPNLDKLASEGMVLEHFHVSIAVCQPSRQALMTGRHPHCNGGLGFQPIHEDVPTLQEQLRAAGYTNGIIGKNTHLAPKHKFCWDYYADPFVPEDAWGRDPVKYYQYTQQFLAAVTGKPFFLMANSHDPHRPFAGSEQERQVFGRETWAPRTFTADEIDVPGFLPDLPDIRTEIAEYYTSVHRLDATVGEILRALDESGRRDDTIVVFLSDNGMAFPFAKTNCYLNSTRSPLIVRWPGCVAPGSRDGEHMAAGIDMMPTLLDALGLPPPEGMNGKSFLRILHGEPPEGFDHVFTTFNATAAGRSYPMRCIQSKTHGYIYNAWANGETVFHNESKNGLTYTAMAAAAADNETIRARVRLFDYRTQEEFYDFAADPDALTNLIGSGAHRDMIARLFALLTQEMDTTNDPLRKDMMA